MRFMNWTGTLILIVGAVAIIWFIRNPGTDCGETRVVPIGRGAVLMCD